jgi:hypothetical protein
VSILDINQFCGTHDDRYWMHNPWRGGGKIYATDGHTLVVVDDDGRELQGEPSTNQDVVVKTVAKWEVACADFKLAAIPDLPPADPCCMCDGTGESQTCLDCDGEGCDCCEDGIVSDSNGKCDDCHGSKVARSQPVKIADVPFSRRLLARLQSLPGCAALHVTGREKVSRFTFDGGYGFIMPMRD